jgi:hypothetical protein
LLAIRNTRNGHKVPDTPKGEADEAASSGLLEDANLETDFTPPMTLGGYRLGGCQVAENACHTGINTAFDLSRNGRRKAQRPHQKQANYKRL